MITSSKREDKMIIKPLTNNSKLRRQNDNINGNIKL